MNKPPKPVTPIEYQTVAELMGEIKTRCRSLVFAATFDGKDGPETAVSVDGCMTECRGMAVMLMDRAKSWTDDWFEEMDAEDDEPAEDV